MNNIIIRNETIEDYREVENLTREAFWNMYMPGCNEHYLVHVVREHQDFIPQLDFIAETDGRIVGSIIYTNSKLTDDNGLEKDILTFGPLSVLPQYQRKVIGKKLLEHSFVKALEMGYDTIVIFGNPGNYVTSGFKSCKKYNICIGDSNFPTAMLVKELKPSNIYGRKWTFSEISAFDIKEEDAENFDKTFETKVKGHQPSQEEFYIYSHSIVK